MHLKKIASVACCNKPLRSKPGHQLAAFLQRIMAGLALFERRDQPIFHSYEFYVAGTYIYSCNSQTFLFASIISRNAPTLVASWPMSSML